MTASVDTSSASKGAAGRRKISAIVRSPDNIHFVLAFIVLLIVGMFIHAYFAWVVKKPVEWPERVKVNELYRNISLPDSLGPFVAIGEDDPLYRETKDQDGADLIIQEDSLGTLGMRTIHDDEKRRAQRRSNWYGIRLYRDTSEKDEFNTFRYWQLEIYYYTGLRGQVPHVPNICLYAGGATSIKQDGVVFRAPDAREPWNGDLRFQRVRYTARLEGGGEVPGVTYYLLGFNDEPVNAETSSRARFIVRYRLSSREVYNYFVKIQFSPFGEGERRRFDIQQADQAAQKFVKSFLPEIVEYLPTKDDIKNQAKQAEEN